MSGAVCAPDLVHNVVCWGHISVFKRSICVVYLTKYVYSSQLVNPRRMREGYGSRFVCECVCVSVTTLAATYLVYTLKIRCR